MSFAPPLKLRMDGAALVANWRTMAALGGDSATGAAVKADAYGLGAREVVPRLWGAGCRDFFVAHWGEAEAIADLVPPASIAVLNGICDRDLAPALALGAVPVLNTPAQAALWRQAGGGRCHVMVDSGINRLGFGPEQADAAALAGLEIDLLLSHLASADEDVPQNARQLACFVGRAASVPALRRSLANSAGIALGPDYCFDLTRPGLALYGGTASNKLSGKIRQVVRPHARILQIRDIGEGEAIGYNATFRAPRTMRVATLAIGYADGYYRAFSNVGTVRIGDRAAPVIGRVSMDLITVDLTGVADAREGDWLEIEFEIAAAAARSGMSQYELLTGLGRRSERVWAD